MGATGDWVLVTDGGTGGSRDALAAVRALAAAGYRPAVTVSGRSWPPPSRRAARRVAVPPVGSPGYADAVREEAAAGYAAVLPASEAALTALGPSLPHLLDKEGLARAAAEAGLEVPPGRSFGSTVEMLDAAARLDFPVVVKPRTRRYLAFRADGPAALARAPLDGGPVVVQPFLSDGLRAVSGVMWRGRLLAVAHERWLRIWPYPCGLACAAETVAPDVDAEERLAALLRGHDGLFCAQFAGRFLFDVNMRIHSSHPLAVAAGANLAALYVDAVRGEARPFARARPGHFYRWLEGDVRHVAAAVRGGRMGAGAALAALRPRPGAAHSTESLTDPVPMLSRLWYSVRRAHLSPEVRAAGSAPPTAAPPTAAPPTAAPSNRGAAVPRPRRGGPTVIVGDPPRMRAEVWMRRRRLHAHRLWLRAVAAAAGTDEPPERPIFVVGCPRSGTTLLFRLLRRHEALGAPHGEGHVLWNTFHHPRATGWSSDRVTSVAPGERRYVYTGVRRLAGGARFMDKTPRNVLKIPYLAELFPGARFVLLKRNGPATVSSLIEGWTVRHGISYRLPEPLRLAEYRGRFWSYVLPEGWRRWAGTSLAEVAAFQYASSYDTALDDFAARPDLPLAEVVFEELLDNPLEVTGRLLEELELPRSERVMSMAADLGAHPVQTNSPPRPEKWRDRADEIARVLPLIAPTMERLGYDARVSI